ncbi:hypothetical protein A5663_00915 [Mycobacterium sp. E740]|nr:hypothetical protein A5663_00915 [Mycobacterium sp. E740]
MSTVLLDTEDLGEAEAVVSANYSKMQFGAAADQRTHTRVVRSTLGAMAFDELRYDYDFDFEGDPIDGIVLCRVKSGVVMHQQPGAGADVCQSGTATAVGRREGVPFSGAVHEGRFDTALIDRGLLNSVAATAFRLGTPKPVKLTAGMPVSPQANDQLLKAFDYVMCDVVTNPDAAQSPLVAGTVARHLAASMLVAFPNNALLEPTIEDRRDSTPLLLRRAIGFIDDNAHNDISLADIAEAVHLTPRAVQYMFRKHRNSTPTAYLREVRLHHARRELLGADRMRTTVNQIAARWGFFHAGRFAVAYREMYGESPHVTLRNSQ